MNGSNGRAVLLASLVRDRRRACGLTQRELAKRAGVSVGAVRDLEQGRTRRPQALSLSSLAEALDLSHEHLRELVAVPAGGPLLQVLGPLLAWRDGMPVRLGGAARRAVLGMLALSPGSLVHREAIIDVLWPDDAPANPVGLVQAHVSRLRRLLESAHPASGCSGDGGLLVAAGSGYRLQVSSEQLDLLMFSRLSDDARKACSRGDVEAGCCLFEQALELWRGDPLADVDLMHGHPDVVRLSRQRAEVVTEYARVASGAGWHRRVLVALRELAAREPLNEQAHAQLMIALAGCGQQAEALTLYQELCRRLDDELGMPPSQDVAEAFRRVLLQEIPPARTGQAVVTAGAGSTAVSSAAVPPRQLPAAPEGFVGREAELSALRRLLQATPETVMISAVGGMPGIGKTALALHWAHQVADDFPDGQLYVNLRGFDPSAVPVPPAQALGWFLEALGVAAEGMPASLQARAALYRSLVAGRRVLIVLDNARDADQARPLLPGSPGCLVLVTSRRQLTGLAASAGARLITLDVLTPAETGLMLTARIGAHRATAEPQAVSDIANLCGSLPLALAVAAARAEGRPGVPLAALADELRDAATRLDALDAGDTVASLRAVFSWSTRQLSPGAARMFRLLGLQPGPDITPPAAASLAACDLTQARQALAELARAHLVTEHTRDRYAFHDLLRAYAADQADVAEDQQARSAAISRLLDHYLNTAHTAAVLISPGRDPITINAVQPGVMPEPLADHKQAMAWLQAEHEDLLAAITLADSAGFDVHAWQIPCTIADFMDRQGHWHQEITTQRIALAALARLSDTAGQALSLRLLARACDRLGDHGQALSYSAASLKLYQQLGDRLGEAKAHLFLGAISEKQGRYADALTHAEQALRLYQVIGHRPGEAFMLNNTGWYLALLGDYQQARTFCRRALTLMAKSGLRHDQGHAWHSLGYVEHHLGNLGEAAACYQRALSLFLEFGDRNSQACTLAHLGDTLQATGEGQQARDAWEQALDILNELHHPDVDQVRAKLAASPRT